MSKIKTKGTVKDIKALDKAVNVSARMKEAFVRTKERTHSLNNDGQSSANEYAENQVESVMRDTDYDVCHGAKDGTKKVIRKVKEAYRNHKDLKEAELKKKPNPTGSNPLSIQRNKNKPAAKNEAEHKKYRIKTKDSKKHSIKQSARSTGKKAVKTSKATIKQTVKSVKTAEKTSKKAIKTAEKTAKATKELAKASAKAARKAVQVAKAVAKAAVATAKAAAKAVAATVKAIIAGIKALVAAIAAGGWVAVVIIIVLTVIAAILGSVYAIFVPAEDNEITIYGVMSDIKNEYKEQQALMIANCQYDVLNYEGSMADWDDVIAVYAVKLNLDSTNPQEVATFNEAKATELRAVFWDMNSLRIETEIVTKTIPHQEIDANGNIVETIKAVKIVNVTVVSDSIDAYKAAENYGFTAEQYEMLADLLDEKNADLWTTLLGSA